MNIDPEATILVVDDFPSARKLVAKSLRRMGINTILEANDGTAAIEILEQEDVDLLVTDWNMPDMGGRELVEFVRSDREINGLPILMITSRGQKEDVVEAVTAGVSGYVVKPFTLETLAEKVGRLLGSRADAASRPG